MRKLATVLAAVTAMASGAAVMQLKITVQEKSDEVRAVAQKIHDDQEAIRILEAEWAFLTTPQALQDRSSQFLALMPSRAKQIASDPTVIPLRPKGVGMRDDSAVSVVLPMKTKSGKNKPAKKPHSEKKGRSL
jgi:cell division protein FtsL